MNKHKILFITYYWPPCGGIGVLRCLKMVKYLHRMGHDITVFVPEGAQYPSLDASNLKEVPEGVNILKGKIWEPHGVFKMVTGRKKSDNIEGILITNDRKEGMMHKLSLWVRSNIFFPDARSAWIRPSVKFLTKYLKENPVDVIISDGPPHTNTRIATLVKQATGIPWIADFQDPWTQVDYFPKLTLTQASRAKHHRMEQEAFDAADVTTIVSPSWKKDLESIGAKNVSVLEWGYDPDDYTNLKRKPYPKFNLAHVGIVSYDRGPWEMFEVILEICKENAAFASDFELTLVGQVDLTIQRKMKEMGMDTYTNFVGSVKRSDALQYVADSWVLLLLLNRQPNAMGRIPGKLFEYLAVGRPTMVLGPDGSDSGTIVEQSHSGVSIMYEDKKRLKEMLLTYYQQYKNGQLNSIEQKNIADYSHPELMKRLEKLIFRAVKK